jgi:hypothetical protein
VSEPHLPKGIAEHIPDYFTPVTVEKLSRVHPTLLVRQMANEITRLQAALKVAEDAMTKAKDFTYDMGVQFNLHTALAEIARIKKGE